MNSLVRPTLAVVALVLLHSPASGQLLLIDLGETALLPNQSGQVRDFAVQNTGPAAVESIFGLNFAFQVGDGASGPTIEAVNLYAVDSISSSYPVNQSDQGSGSRVAFFGIDSGGPGLSIPGHSSTLLARITFDTTGILSGSGPWTVSAQDVGPKTTDSRYVLVGGASRPIDSFVDGTLTIVPEPASSGLAVAALMIAAIVVREFTPRNITR